MAAVQNAGGFGNFGKVAGKARRERGRLGDCGRELNPEMSETGPGSKRTIEIPQYESDCFN
jgi:hypothetical protein